MSHPAFDELLQHSAALRRLARDLVGASSADDVLQDAAVEVLRSPPRRPGPALGWLRGVVRNLAGKRRRADAVRRRHEAEVAHRGESFVEAGAEAADTLRRLTELVTTLPEPYRSTLLARYLSERSPSEIAAATGASVQTVKTQLQRGLQLLRERFDQRREDWRAALCGAFGFDSVVGVGATAPGAVLTTVAVTKGILLMTTTTKVTLAAVAVLAVGFGVWRWSGIETPVVGRVVVAQDSAAAVPTESVSGTSAWGENTVALVASRTVATPPAPTVPPATTDAIVVHVVDAASGTPIESYALREHRARDTSVGAKEAPLRHAGHHPDGRVVVPLVAFEQRTFVVEDAQGRYPPSRWFDAKNAVERDGERIIDVTLPQSVEVTLRVVRERTGEPLAGTRFELLRPWPESPEVTLRTQAQPSSQFRAQADLSPPIMNMIGGLALLL
ncbi:MAG: sigma-70 family RNA polymerase sigma factor, partial [Planctomycetota bacterium]